MRTTIWTPSDGESRRNVGGRSYPGRVNVEFSAEIWFWKGPSPWHWVTVPDEECGALEATVALVSYGWGMIPVRAQIGDTEWTTSLTPKDGQYILPLKTSVRRAEGIELGDTISVRLTIDA